MNRRSRFSLPLLDSPDVLAAKIRKAEADAQFELQLERCQARIALAELKRRCRERGLDSPPASVD